MTPALRAHLRSLTPADGRIKPRTPGIAAAVIDYRSIPSPCYGDMTRIARRHGVNRKSLHSALYYTRWAEMKSA